MSDYEYLKLCAARYVWKRRSNLTPESKITWKKWWEKKFKDDYYQYTRKMSEKKKT